MRAEDDRAAGWVDRITNRRLHGTIGSAPSTESSNPYASGGEFGAQSRGDEVMGGLIYRSALAASPLGPFLEEFLRPLRGRSRVPGWGVSMAGQVPSVERWQPSALGGPASSCGWPPGTERIGREAGENSKRTRPDLGLATA